MLCYGQKVVCNEFLNLRALKFLIEVACGKLLVVGPWILLYASFEEFYSH